MFEIGTPPTSQGHCFTSATQSQALAREAMPWNEMWSLRRPWQGFANDDLRLFYADEARTMFTSQSFLQQDKISIV
jgi:hypothetical protein